MQYLSTISTVALLAALTTATPFPADGKAAPSGHKPVSSSKASSITFHRSTTAPGVHLPLSTGGAGAGAGGNFIGTGKLTAIEVQGGKAAGCLDSSMRIEANKANCPTFTGKGNATALTLTMDGKLCGGDPVGQDKQLQCDAAAVQGSVTKFGVKSGSTGQKVLALGGVSQFTPAKISPLTFGPPAVQLYTGDGNGQGNTTASKYEIVWAPA